MSNPTLVVTRLPDAVYDAVRERILTRQELPGAPVTEQAIADRFGVARPTAKAALERLVAEGLLRRTAHKTARVPSLTREDIVDLYANRATLEVAALANLATAVATGAAPVPPAALSAQRELAHALDSAEHDTAPLARADIAFHRALVEGQPSPRLARLHALLMGEIELCTGQVQAHRLLALADVVDQHQRILAAVAAGDADAAARLTRAHIEGARDRLLAHYDATLSASNDEPTDERE